MNVLDLFSGIGGFSLGLERAGMRTVAFCEIEPYARAVLRKHWPTVPCYGDIHRLTAERLARDGIGRVDLVSGGYPCQPFSHAGKQLGHEDPRHLWPQMRRVVGEVRPAWVLAENVTGHITLGLDQVLTDLETDGYAARAIVVPACAVDAPHIRQRVWIVARDRDRESESARAVDAEMEGVPGDLADTESDGRQPRRTGDTEKESRGRDAGRGVVGADVPNTDDAGRREQRRPESVPPEHSAAQRSRRWEPEPGVGRVAHGIPARVDRLRALGNAVVPQVVEEIGRAIMSEHGRLTA